MFSSPHPASSPHAGLHLIEDQRDSVFCCYPLQLIEERLWWDEIPTLALYWFDYDSRYFAGRNGGAEPEFDFLHTFEGAGFRSAAVWATIAIRIRYMMNPGDQRAEPPALN